MEIKGAITCINSLLTIYDQSNLVDVFLNFEAMLTISKANTAYNVDTIKYQNNNECIDIEVNSHIFLI